MSSFKKILRLWKLADTLTVQQAAALIAGVEPSAVVFDKDGTPQGFKHEGNTEANAIHGCQVAFNALKNDINGGKLKATIRHDARLREFGESPGIAERVQQGVLVDEGDPERGFSTPPFIYRETPNWKETTVDRSDLVAWLESRGFNTGFFFPKVASSSPNYLNPKHPRYAPKLAAAVRVWRATEDTGGKTAKQAIRKWLREHATQFGLTGEDGLPVKSAIEAIAKIANWQPEGGAPTTPDGR